MSQKESQKENSQKAVLTQIQNQAIIVASQGEVKSQLQTQSQDRVQSQDRGSQASSCVASQGQDLTQPQLTTQNGVSSQDRVPSQVQDSQNFTSQATVRNCQCCKCCKDLPHQLARKKFYKEKFYKPHMEKLMKELYPDEHDKKPNE